MVSCLANSTEMAQVISAPLIIPFMLFGGFFLQNGAVPVYFDWMRYLSWFMYGNEALSINQWRGVSFNDTVCSLTMNGDEICSERLFTGEQILKDFQFNPVGKKKFNVQFNISLIYRVFDFIPFRIFSIVILLGYSH